MKDIDVAVIEPGDVVKGQHNKHHENILCSYDINWDLIVSIR